MKNKISPIQNGYTLLELIVVILVIGVLSAIAIARMSNPSANLSSVAEMIVTDLRELQALAMADGRPVVIAFYPDYYRVYQGSSELTGLQFPRQVGDLNARIIDPHKVGFDTFGEPMNGRDKILVRSTVDSTEYTIVVEEHTGYASVQ